MNSLDVTSTENRLAVGFRFRKMKKIIWWVTFFSIHWSIIHRYCPACKNDGSEIVKAGEKLKESKKKAKAPSTLNKNPTRDWGRGMACAGRNKECTIVPSNHFGPIPGVDVGTTWRFRFQVLKAPLWTRSQIIDHLSLMNHFSKVYFLLSRNFFPGESLLQLG